MSSNASYRDPLRPRRARYLTRAIRAAAADPFEGAEKVKEKVTGRYERARHGGAVAPPTGSYVANPSWEQRLHELCDAPWPCPLAREFEQVWSEVLSTMGEHGLRVGRQNYGGDDDGDCGLVRAAWCLTRHVPASTVVETGVGHGVTSRALLEALAANGAGRLWSIDLAPLTISERNPEIGAAVPAKLRGSWSYLRGSSRRHLPQLLARLGEIELFVHDSRHSTRNVAFECERAFGKLRAGGWLVVDDIDGNWGFHRFRERHPQADCMVAVADDQQRYFGLARKPATGGRRTMRSSA